MLNLRNLNAPRSTTRYFTSVRWRKPFPLFVLLLAASLVGWSGCAAPAGARDELNAGYQSLGAKQYDSAVSSADAFLAKHPEGAGRAEAFYLRGRAIQDRALSRGQITPAEYQQVRGAYAAALTSAPAPVLEGHIRADLGNVEFFQDEYGSAAKELSAAYEKLDKPDDKAGALFRLGRCQQRMGQFGEADTTFSTVEEKYADTKFAAWARERQGYRAYYVQLVTYRSAADADREAQSLRRQGVTPARVTNAAGQTVLRIGPLNSYAEARGVRERFASRYRDAMILP